MFRTTVLCTLLVATPAAAQRDSAITTPLATLVANALRYNTTLRSAVLLPRLAAADVLSARRNFDPSLTLGSDRSNKANDVLGVSPRATQSALTTAATLSAMMPVGSQVAMTLRNSHLLSDPSFLSAAAPFPTSNAASLNVSFIQPLLRGFGRDATYGQVEGATYAVDAEMSRYARAVDVVLASVEHAYWALRQAEANETVLRRSVDASRAIYQRNVALRDRDVATALDVLTSERGLATRETQLWEATRQRLDAAERLLFLAYGEQARDGGDTRASMLRVERDSLALPEVPSLADALRLALAQRADGIAARRDVDAESRRAAQAHRQRLPKLDLIASYGYGGTTAGSRFLSYADSADIRSSTWSLGLSASVFGRNDAAAAEDQRAEATLESVRIAQSAADNVIVADVRAAVRAVTTERERFTRARDVLSLAEREYAVAQEGSRLGLVSTFQLLQYEDQLSQARLLHAQARFALEDAGTQYRLATGSIRTRYGAQAP